MHYDGMHYRFRCDLGLLAVGRKVFSQSGGVKYALGNVGKLQTSLDMYIGRMENNIP